VGGARRRAPLELGVAIGRPCKRIVAAGEAGSADDYLVGTIGRGLVPGEQ
jgi:hypothetical protein